MENPTAQRLLTGSSEPGLASTSSDGEIIRSHNIERLINMNHRQVPSKRIYSDRFIPFRTGSRLSCIDTGSQVCNIVWSKNVNELVSTHGLSTDEGNSQNQIIVWEYPTMSKLAALTGHTDQILYLAVSPDGQNIVTGDGDETLMLWNIFPHAKSQNKDNMFGIFFSGRTTIR